MRFKQHPTNNEISQARIIAGFAKTCRSSVLSKLRGEIAPEGLLAQVPTIGPGLAPPIVEVLRVQSLEELKQTAHNGRLASLKGFGPRRTETIQLTLAGMLGRRAQQRWRNFKEKQSGKVVRRSIETPLQLDELYHSKAASGELKLIAPRRLNPEGIA